MPGIINAHVHYLPDALQAPERWIQEGVTTMVDLGGSTAALQTIRNQFAEAQEPRFRLLIAGGVILRKNSSMVRHWGGTNHFQVLDTEADAVAAVEGAKAMGVHVIKIGMATGEFGELSERDVCAIVQTAAKHGLAVIAHVDSENDVLLTSRCGVKAITHVPTLSSATLNLMAERGIGMIPTLSVYGGTGLNRILATIDSARQLGIKIAVGNDFPNANLAPGMPLLEMQRLQAAGFSINEVIQTATLNSVALINWDKVTGSLEVGKFADLLLIEGTQLTDLNQLKNIRHVFLRGKQVK